MNYVDKPLRAIIREGVLRIEIGVETLAFCTHAIPGFHCPQTDKELLKIDDAKGFAKDVLYALMAEAEDGSTLLTRCLDKAMQEAVEQGSAHVFELTEK